MESRLVRATNWAENRINALLDDEIFNATMNILTLACLASGTLLIMLLPVMLIILFVIGIVGQLQ